MTLKLEVPQCQCGTVLLWLLPVTVLLGSEFTAHDSDIEGAGAGGLVSPASRAVQHGAALALRNFKFKRHGAHRDSQAGPGVLGLACRRRAGAPATAGPYGL